MTRSEELAAKLDRVRQWLVENSQLAAWYRTRANFAWITCGGQSFVSAASDTGVGSVLVTPDHAYLMADNIELRRLVEEELGAELADQFEPVEWPWHEPTGGEVALRSILGSASPACDTGDNADSLQALRNPLTEAELDRYADLGRLAAQTTEAVCRRIERGVSEHDIEAMVIEAFARQGVRVPVCLIAADERLMARRHPIPKPSPVDRRVMVVVCAERQGLWVSLTRLVSFEPLDGEMQIKHRAVCQIDAAAAAATRPGASLGEVFGAITNEYDTQGFADEWRLHHQGGSTGYQGRDVFATPGCEATVVEGQAFAWNPSITGTKSEDTFVTAADGPRWISEPGLDWPCIEVERDGQTYRRANILVV